MKKRIILYSAMLIGATIAAAQDLSVPTIDIYADIMFPQREFAMRSASGSTPVFRLYTVYDGNEFNAMTGTVTWAGIFYYYGADWNATNWVDIPSTTSGSNYLDFACAVGDTATNGEFTAFFVVTNSAGKVYRWGPGALTLDYVPPLLYGGVGLDLSSSGTDHGGMTGLSDDDHPQYVLTNDTASVDLSGSPSVLVPEYGTNDPADAVSYSLLTSSVSSVHNDMTGKQGGTTAEYYHFTAAEHTILALYGAINPSANVQSLLGAANYAAMLTLLDLEIGIDVQAWSAVLDTLATLDGGSLTNLTERDPVWVAVSNTVTTGAALGATSVQSDMSTHMSLGSAFFIYFDTDDAVMVLRDASAENKVRLFETNYAYMVWADNDQYDTQAKLATDTYAIEVPTGRGDTKVNDLLADTVTATDFVGDGGSLTNLNGANVQAGTIDETALDVSVNASLDLADSAIQSWASVPSFVIEMSGTTLYDAEGDALDFDLELAENGAWTNSTYLITTNSTAGWSFWNGSSMRAFPATGLPSEYCDQDTGLVIYESTNTAATIWARFRSYDGADFSDYRIRRINR